MHGHGNDNNITPRPPSRLTSNGDYLFWTEGLVTLASLKRLPNDVDALPKVDMAVTGWEVTQSVQRDDNAVRQIRGRATFVRVFAQGMGQDVPGATMRLYGAFNGMEHGPLLPLNATHITVKATPNKNLVGDSFFFQLPHDWTLQSQVSLRAELNPFRVPPEPNYGNNSLSGATVTFSPAYPMRVIFVEANYRIQRSLNDFTDYMVADTGVHAEWLRRAYPIAEDGLSYYVWTINGGALLGNRVTQSDQACQAMPAASRSLCASDWVNAKIAEIRSSSGYGAPAGTYFYGLIPDSSGSGGAFPRGQGGTDRVGSGPAGVSITNSSYSDYGYYTGHEVGHELGRQHPVPNSDDPATTTDMAGNPIIEGCGHSRDDAAYPYASALIGPGTGFIRGFDRAQPGLSSWPRPAVLADTQSFDMMSYCGNSQIRWPSDYTYEGLYQALKGAAGASAAGSPVVQAGDWLGAFGALYADQAIVHNLARLDGVLEPTPDNNGDYAVRLLSATGDVLAGHLFQPEAEQDGGQAFAVVVPYAAGTARVQIVRATTDQGLFDRSVSANAPVVSAVSLPGAPNPVDDTVTVAWQAGDADGDALTFDLLYSFDSGFSFQPVALGIADTSILVDTTLLGGGSGLFRVIASDGVNRGQADSGPFTMAVKAPKVRILSPAEGSQFNWGQLVTLSGEALDSLDGLLSDTSFVWTNDKGVLGSGNQLSVDDLPVGVNHIALAAMNSAGLSGLAQVTITVGDVLDLPGPTLDVTPSVLSFQFAPGATQAQTTQIVLSNSGGGVLKWSAESNVNWLAVGAAGGDVPATINVTASPAGLAPGTAYSGMVILTATGTGYPSQVRTVPVGLSIGNTFGNPTGSKPPVSANGRLYLPMVVR